MSGTTEQLREAGYAPAGQGGVALSGAAARLYQAWARLLAGRFAPYHAHIAWAPPFIEEDVLERAGYLAHFPQQVFVARSYMQAQALHRYLTPAACLHVYPGLRGKDLASAPFVGFVMGQCARYEGGRWEYPFRLAGFEMAELVVVGTEAKTEELYEEMRSLAPAMLRGLGFEVEARAATDAFFMGNSEGARVMQKLKGVKEEYTVRLGREEVALASLNKHETYFTRRFGIGAPEEPHLHSFCLAFGLERLTACGLLLWGAEETNWPEELRA